MTCVSTTDLKAQGVPLAAEKKQPDKALFSSTYGRITQLARLKISLAER
jgi:hypothetical protein